MHMHTARPFVCWHHRVRATTSTPLSRAAAKGHLGVVTLLLERGAAVNIPGRGGLTPLHEAAGCGQVRGGRAGGTMVTATDIELFYPGFSCVAWCVAVCFHVAAFPCFGGQRAHLQPL